MKIGYCNAQGFNQVEHWYYLEQEELKRRGHEIYEFNLRYKPPERDKIKELDIIHIHFAQVADHFKRLGKPFIISPHAHDIWRDEGATLKRASQHNNCVAVSYQSFYHKRKFEEWGIEKPLVYLPMCCRTELFKRDEFRYNRVLAGGRLIPKKGLDRIVDKIHNLTVFGDGPLRESLEAQARRWSKDSGTQFTGWLDGQELKDLMEESWLFLNPSIVTNDGDSDGLPNTIKEAMLMRMHVISTPVAGIPELENITLLSDWSNIWEIIEDMPKQWNWKGDKEIRGIYNPKSCVDRLLKGIEEYGNIT